MCETSYEDIVIRGFVENGLLISSLTNPEIEFPYAIFKFSELSISHLDYSLRNIRLNYNYLKQLKYNSIHFYVNGYYPFIYNMEKLFRNVIIFTTENYKKYYTNFCKYKNVFIEDEFENVQFINNDKRDTVLKYYIVDDEIDNYTILNNDDNKDLIIQSNNSILASHFNIMNRNYKILKTLNEHIYNGIKITHFSKSELR